MRTIVITGGASGIGAAAAARLRSGGDRVITVDLADADIDADLSTDEGVAAMVEAVGAEADELHGVIAGAGIAAGRGDRVIAVNYFGALGTLEGLRPLLVDRSAAIAISSNSVTTIPQIAGLADALLADDREQADALAATDEGGLAAYPASKLALARWVRRHAPSDAWIGRGIRLNAIAPGFTATPMTEGNWEMLKSLGDAYPMPAPEPATAEQMGGLLCFLLSPDAQFFVGSVIFCDGGTDAAMRTDDWPLGIEVPPPG